MNSGRERSRIAIRHQTERFEWPSNRAETVEKRTSGLNGGSAPPEPRTAGKRTSGLNGGCAHQSRSGLSSTKQETHTKFQQISTETEAKSTITREGPQGAQPQSTQPHKNEQQAVRRMALSRRVQSRKSTARRSLGNRAASRAEPYRKLLGHRGH